MVGNSEVFPPNRAVGVNAGHGTADETPGQPSGAELLVAGVGEVVEADALAVLQLDGDAGAGVAPVSTEAA
jgi:hypothetical protein